MRDWSSPGARQLEDALKDAGMTPAELAHRVGVTKHAVQAWNRVALEWGRGG